GFGNGNLTHHQHELLAAKTRNQILRPRIAAKLLGKLMQGDIAGAVTVAVVYRLKTIKVEDNDSVTRTKPVGYKVRKERAAVHEPRQRIRGGLLRQPACHARMI